MTEPNNFYGQQPENPQNTDNNGQQPNYSNNNQQPYTQPGYQQQVPQSNQAYAPTNPQNPSGGYGQGAYTPQQPQGQAYGQQQYQQQYNPAGGYAQQPAYGYAPQMVSTKSKLAAGLLGIFLGAFGVHNFYLGQTGKAVAQLLITLLSFGFLSWVSGIWGLIEGIMILVSRPGTPWHRDSQGFELQD
ncbi:MAG: NINE protein [Bifidobacterium sp.]|jgi:TM2 domain-containing membrane protein YozV|nr:NINE protein [Bifidobacterium sp.]MCH4174992.1 NINE protein [Bifidobacterium sp.]